MEQVLEKIKKECDLIIADIIKDYDSKGMRASGQFAKNLESRASQQGTKIIGEIYGLSYAEQLNSGRGPTSKFAKRGSPTLFEKIQEWIVYKKIQPYGRRTIDAVVRAITFSIHKRGWKRDILDLINDVLTNKRVSDVIDRIGVAHVDLFVEAIITELKKLNLSNVNSNNAKAR